MATVEKTPTEIVRQNAILREKAWERMHVQDENWMACLVGETGSGKSWAGLRIAEALDPDFSIDQVAFSIEEFLQLVIDDSYGPGSVILFEEASISASNRNWYSKGNEVLRQVLDTWRHQNRGAIFTLPTFSRLDKAARERMHALIQMCGKNIQAGFTTAKYKWIDTDSDTGKIYKKYPRLNGKVYKKLKLRKPSESLRDDYEQRKEEFTDDLNTRLLEELLEEKREAEEEEVSPKDVAEEILTSGEVDEFIADNHGQKYLDRDLLQMEYDLSAGDAKKAKKLLQREGDLDVM